MDIDGAPAAYNLCFNFGRKIYGWGTAFRERFRELSPGTVLMERVLRDAFAAGHREFDFTRGDESYKNLWTTHSRHNYECVMYSPALRTRVAVDVLYRCRWALRGNPYARRAKIACRIVRERLRRTIARAS
jgi:CelD/BcsL family acetyltransferase involved in cellulose biosynthesis